MIDLDGDRVGLIVSRVGGDDGCLDGLRVGFDEGDSDVIVEGGDGFMVETPMFGGLVDSPDAIDNIGVANIEITGDEVACSSISSGTKGNNSASFPDKEPSSSSISTGIPNNDPFDEALIVLIS